VATYGSLRRECARFDRFQVDLSSGELFRSGVVYRFRATIQVMRLLLEAEGRVVYPRATARCPVAGRHIRDFEHGVNPP